MSLFSKIDLPRVETKISYQSNLFFLGSCFSENVGDEFLKLHFSVLQNPLGILFHPFGIEQFLALVSGEKTIDNQLLLEHEGTWKSYQASSKLYAETEEELVKKLQTKVEKSKHFLANASHVFISLGTAWGYYLSNPFQQNFVVNCHKQPQSLFAKKIASANAIEASLLHSIRILQQLTKASIWFTVSPVRHQKDGWVQNTRSKANLFSALHNCLDIHPEIGYFPAYELMMDELRDYRFYGADLLHPNELGIRYIWKKIEASFVDEPTQKTIQQVVAYQKLKNHRSLTEKHAEKHRQKVKSMAQQLQKKGIPIPENNE